MKADSVKSSSKEFFSSSKDADEDMMDVVKEEHQRQKEASSSEQRVESRQDDGSASNERDGAEMSRASPLPQKQQHHRQDSGSISSQGGHPYSHDPYRGPGPYGYPPQRSHPSYPPPPFGYAPAPGSSLPPPPPHWDRSMGHPPQPHYAAPLSHSGQQGAPPPHPPHYNSYHYPPHPGMTGRPSYHGPPPYQPPPHSMYHPYHGGPPPPSSNSYQRSSASSDTSSIGSSRSMGTKKTKSKKRTIEGLADNNDFPFRRATSDSSSCSTVTHANNTSTETPYLVEDSPQKNNMPSANLFEDEAELNTHQKEHRRDGSMTSTTSSISAGGFSMQSYERANKTEHPFAKASPKRRKAGDRTPSAIDTEHNSRFEQLSMDEEKRDSGSRNLFLSLSTSPINNSDIDATPSIKNKKKPDGSDKKGNRNRLNSFDRDAPTPTVDIMAEDHVLNQHLRSQTFTPLSHLNGEGRDNQASPNHAFPAIAPQLSWSIAGDAPSLADLGSWDEHDPLSASKGDSEQRQSESRISHQIEISSPHSDMDPGTTTPLPIYFHQTDSMDEGENAKKSSPDQKPKAFNFGEPIRSSDSHFGESEHIHKMFTTNGGRGNSNNNSNNNNNSASKPFRTHSSWSSDPHQGRKNEHGGPVPGQVPSHTQGMRLPPTPGFNDHRDGFGRSPHSNHDGGSSNFFSNPMFGRNERVRNLRGHGPGPIPSNHHVHMHMPPPMSHHNLTSPIGVVSNGGKVTSMWGTPMHGSSPHRSPHGSMQPMDINSSKQKCVALKPPLPSKFQGDIEKVKTAQVPEFTSLVNFPAHMSQKQSVNLPDGMRCCVMCGQACACSANNKAKKGGNKAGTAGKGGDGGLANRNGNGMDSMKDSKHGGGSTSGGTQNFAIIPTQNKGLCTLCDVNVWVVTQSGLEIKWCKGCKNFRPWAAFGDKGLATKCLRCRERQREKYALQKEEKEKARSSKAKAAKA